MISLAQWLKSHTLILLFLFANHCTASDPLSIEQKVGQLLIAHFNGEVANEETRILIQDIGVGGIIYYNWSNGLLSPQQVLQLSASLQKLAKESKASIPLFLAVDQEGGAVARLGFTLFPTNQMVGETDDPQLAGEVARMIGEELNAVGINVNLAPVVDINSNPNKSIIGTRSFGSSPEKVVIFGAQALKSYRQTNVIAVLKHFPGHGEAHLDSHIDLPVIDKSMEELEKCELVPFSQLAKDADVIMTAHLLVPALDKENCSTLSKKTLDYLKTSLNFQGVIVTDSLVMQGVLKQCATVDEAAIRALEAGCDILLLGGRQLVDSRPSLELTVSDVNRIKNSILGAIATGRLSEESVQKAYEKVLKLKARRLTFKSFELPLDFIEHQRSATQITSKAIINKALKIANLHANKIAEQIWQNECGKSVEGLTCWKKGEGHASLGIGHFIWYPADKKGPFKETFPELLAFLEEGGIEIPKQLTKHASCPWNTREEFYNDFHTSKMEQLRTLLFDTRDRQFIFMVKRLQQTIPSILSHCAKEEYKHISTLLHRLVEESNGVYALLDYLNFKGAGLSSSESYNGKGWGLLQVLQGIPHTSQHPLIDFVHSGKSILKQRVENSPPERNESAWLEGWLNRLTRGLCPLDPHQRAKGPLDSLD